MKTLKSVVASVVVVAAMAAGVMAPALAQDAKKTMLVNDKGETVDSLLMRYRLDATWVIDNSRILLRDANRDYYLVSLKKECVALDLKQNFKFFPALEERVRAGVDYEVRNRTGPYCDIGKIEQVADETAQALRTELAAKG